MMVFFLIPYAELNQRMINLSLSRNKAQIPTKIYQGIVTPFYVLEVTEINAANSVFMNYVSYYADELEKAVPSIPSQKLKRTGIIFDTVNAGQTKTASYTVLENKLITGLIFKANNSIPGDKITVKVHNAQNVVVSELVTDAYVSDTLIKEEIPSTLIPATYVIKTTYTSTAGLGVISYFINVQWSNE